MTMDWTKEQIKAHLYVLSSALRDDGKDNLAGIVQDVFKFIDAKVKDER